MQAKDGYHLIANRSIRNLELVVFSWPVHNIKSIYIVKHMKKEIDKWKQFNYTKKRPEHTLFKIKLGIGQKKHAISFTK